MSIQASTNDNATLIFADMLRIDGSIRVRGTLQLPSYHDHLILTKITNQPTEDAEAGKCWFNCLRAQAAGAGQVVYGWALWFDTLDREKVFFSQHHAVLRTPNGLVDITPYINVNGQLSKPSPITFLIDSRVPFDTEQGKFPAALIWHSRTNVRYWGVRQNATDPWDKLTQFTLCRFGEGSDWKSYL